MFPPKRLQLTWPLGKTSGGPVTRMSIGGAMNFLATGVGPHLRELTISFYNEPSTAMYSHDDFMRDLDREGCRDHFFAVLFCFPFVKIRTLVIDLALVHGIMHTSAQALNDHLNGLLKSSYKCLPPPTFRGITVRG